LVLLAALGIVLTFTEPPSEQRSHEQARPSLRAVLRQSLAVMRDRPTLRFSMVYLAIVPLASFMIESEFIQPQALAWACRSPGSASSSWPCSLRRWRARPGQRVSRRAWAKDVPCILPPIVICSSLLLLAALQVMPALLLIMVERTPLSVGGA
jgi:hypothetical protein